jgi:hypothetical protein
VCVPLVGRRSYAWKEAFVRAAETAEAHGQRWRSVRIWADYVEIRGVGEGAEELLREWLEAAGVRAEEDARRRRAEAERQREDFAARSALAERMTGRLRSGG